MGKKSKKHKSEKRKINEVFSIDDDSSENGRLNTKRSKLSKINETIIISDDTANEGNSNIINNANSHQENEPIQLKHKKKKKHKSKIIEIDSDENEIKHSEVKLQKKRNKKKHKVEKETLSTVRNNSTSVAEYSSTSMISTLTVIKPDAIPKTPKKHKMKHKKEDKYKNNKTNYETLNGHSSNNLTPEHELAGSDNCKVKHKKNLKESNFGIETFQQRPSLVETNNKPSASKEGFHEDGNPELEVSTFAERFGNLLSQSSKTKVKNIKKPKIDLKESLEDKDNKIEEWYHTTPYTQYSFKKKQSVAYFKRKGLGTQVDVDLRKAEKMAQNEILCRNIVAYNRDVNNLSSTNLKLNTPVFQYCSKNPQSDAFISDFEISSESEDDEAAVKQEPDIKFIKTSKFNFKIKVLNKSSSSF